ncbi:hypothetical protein MPTK1_8g09260 [Marchantia polymorpha subsp. ruderalis]|uniref:Uncharacterized protein n=1 Tax=Marchantia polymorpha TaxID=3197 RepID=A0A2R6W2E7_MARPO|nr:hypothetical protein MARPO_0176s0009 [Marchantia polymorpha]BBN19273.1 hypothetical protein Mp_8g09260 [Marchantia polymorpha subsp. ruderalis]|eukprot:PTQ28025.1 hypothetical protein MARPO_0176s0009 [Marchantia polymorpha]
MEWRKARTDSLCPSPESSRVSVPKADGKISLAISMLPRAHNVLDGPIQLVGEPVVHRGLNNRPLLSFLFSLFAGHARVRASRRPIAQSRFNWTSFFTLFPP